MKKKLIICSIVCSLSLLLLTFYNSSRNYKDLKIVTKTINSYKIDNDADGLLIAYFSDLYFKDEVDVTRINNLVNSLNNFDPDIILFSGDLFEEKSITNESEQYLIEQFSSLKPRYGKYAVYGDNDLRNENTKLLFTDIISGSGFELLSNNNKTIYIDNDSAINLIFIDSMINGSPDYDMPFLNLNENYYSIVITHCPDTYKMINHKAFDLCLSGHSLGGGVYIPLVSYLFTEDGFKNYYHGSIQNSGKQLLITNGSGTPSNKHRLNSDPEILLISLRTK